MRRRLTELAAAVGLVGVSILVLPGLAQVFAYVALVVGTLAFLRAGLSPASLSARSIVTAVFLAGAMVWPLAKSMNVDTPIDETGAHGLVLRVMRAVHKAETSYEQVNGYFDSLECLLQTPCIAGIPSPPRYLSADVMREIELTGYRFQFRSGPRAVGRRPGDPVSPTGTMAYAMVATPSAAAARSGATHAYCGDGSGRIYMAPDGRLPLVESGRCVDRSHPLQ